MDRSEQASPVAPDRLDAEPAETKIRQLGAASQGVFKTTSGWHSFPMCCVVCGLL